jgi:hypothetical protein
MRAPSGSISMRQPRCHNHYQTYGHLMDSFEAKAVSAVKRAS